MTVRPATLADIPDILRMAKVCYPTLRLPGALPPDMPHLQAMFEGWISAQASDHIGFFVAIAPDGSVCGASAVARSPMWLNPEPVAFGMWRWVDKAHRGHGHGYALREVAELWARSRALPVISWSLPVHDRRSHKELERAGYTPLETHFTKSL